LANGFAEWRKILTGFSGFQTFMDGDTRALSKGMKEDEMDLTNRSQQIPVELKIAAAVVAVPAAFLAPFIFLVIVKVAFGLC
jgi:hypothetical protein